MTARNPVLFDSHALLKFFQRESGRERVARLIDTAGRSRARKLLCAINLGEIIYITKRAFGDQKKLEVLAHIERLEFTILPVPNSLVFRAAELKAEHSILYADCFSLAAALEHKAAIVTGDPEFKKVANLVTVEWIE